MKKIIYISLSLLLAVGFTSCGKDFLDTPYDKGEELDKTIVSPVGANIALTGAYFTFANSYFAGRNAVALGDVSTEIVGNNNATTHFYSIYAYNISTTDVYLRDIWEHGYKTIDNASRIIEASENLYITADNDDKAEYNPVLAQAYGLRAVSMFYLVNIYGLQYKVDGGVDNGATLGVLASNKVVKPFEKVERSTVAQTYAQINLDIAKALEYFELTDDLDPNYINTAALYALTARVALYSQNYDAAITAAQKAIDINGGTIITSSADAYKAMFTTTTPNQEDILSVFKSTTEDLTANSIGTLYSNYGLSPSVNFTNKFAANTRDIRYPLMTEGGIGAKDYMGGKYIGIPASKSVCNIPLFRLPEMYLIQAEAHLKKASPSVVDAQTALIEVARRNPAIQSVADLPSDAAGLMTFIEDERVRELCQEGHHFYDLRRWGKIVNVRSNYQPFDIAKFCYPVPAAEVNSASGIVQTEGWQNALPKAKPVV